MIFSLYIDPGTGSALFSILIGAIATLYFVGRALILKFKVVLSGGKVTAKDTQNFVIYNEGKQYWNVFKPVIEEFENNKTQVVYLTSHKDDPVFTYNYNFVKPEYIGQGNKAYARLNLLKANFCLMTTPGLDIYQLKRSKGVKHYSHVLHSPADTTTYKLFGLDYFDSVLLTGDYQAEDIRTLEKLRGIKEKQLYTAGCTYLDVYAQNINNIPQEENHPFTVLVSPSWGASALLSLYGEKLLDPLRDTGFRIIIRPHPQSKLSETSILNRLEERYKNNENIIWDCQSDNIYSLKKSDIMISDFSGIVFDYMFLCNKPVLYVKNDFDPTPYDVDDIKDNKLWQFEILKEAGIELKEDDFINIKKIIENAGTDESLLQAREKAKREAWQHPGQAGKRIYEFMLKTVNA